MGFLWSFDVLGLTMSNAKPNSYFGSVPILLIKLICIKSCKINQYESHYFDFSIYLEAKKVI